MIYASIDIETFGLDPELHDMWEFGAVLDDFLTPLEDLPRFHTFLIRPDGNYRGNIFAFNMHRDRLDILANPKKYPEYDFMLVEDLQPAFQTFLQSHQSKFLVGDKINAAGKNFANFDAHFLKPHLPDLKFHHRTLDPAMLYFDPKIDATLPDTKQCMERAGIGGEVAHTAVDDALVVIQLLRHKLCENY